MTHVNLTVQTPDWETKTPEERRAWSLALDQAVTNLGQITAWSVEGVPGDEESPQYDWVGWEAEPEMTGDGSGDPEKHFLTIRDPAGVELALIVHRTVGGAFPLDGEVANEKTTDADMIVAALNGRTSEPERDEAPECPFYCVELLVKEHGEHVAALSVGPFSTWQDATTFGLISQARSVLSARARAEEQGVSFQVEGGDLRLPASVATLVSVYGEGEEETLRKDLFPRR